ncbi:MAG: CusA/CzcA family heavy metal efflux RND transporter, partial [Gemmataceae bacterium]|nr:CusA/CzcA family heavy metal efflux RND transporter [Gemmataceae bacterium]
MLSRVIEFSARNRFLIVVLIIAIVAGGLWAIYNTPLDAIPDLSDVQVIVYTQWEDRSPDIIEDQVTYPIVTQLLSAPKVKVVRANSFFGFSLVYVIFEDGTDIYWARSRVLEYLNQIRGKLPEGVNPALGPDATGVGWVYQYALVTGYYSPDYPKGWYELPANDTSLVMSGREGEAPAEPARPEPRPPAEVKTESGTRAFASPKDAPASVRSRLVYRRIRKEPGNCPISGKLLVKGQHDLTQLRSLQDWSLRYALAAVEGVAEVATVGGFVRQYQVTVDPNRLLALNVPLEKVVESIRKSNNDVGGRVVEMAGAEYMVRGLGYIKSLADIEEVVVGADESGTPIYVRDVGEVAFGPDMRRGLAELNGEGETVGGIVVMRYQENALNVIRRVETKIQELRTTLPAGVDFVTVYDRSELIEQAIGTATEALWQEMLIVSALIVFILLHFRSALIPIIGLPIAVLIAFIPQSWMGLTINVMSLGGIVIAIGDMVDASIVLVENSHKRLEEWEREGKKGNRLDVIIASMKEVGPPIFASLLVMAIAFMPVFTLEAQEGRLFKPLAFTKNFAIAIAAVLAVTLTPALMTLLIRGRIRPEQKHPVTRFLTRLYTPLARGAIRFRKTTVALALLAALLTLPAFVRLGSEFMPPLEEGSILYMPTTLPGISVTEANKLVQVQDRILKSFPEVQSVFGKAGRAETPTDPAPFSMMETTVVLKPKSQWRPGMTFEKLVAEMDAAMRFPGLTNAWTMPIRARIDMLTTGIRTPIGIKIFGPDLEKIQEIGTHLEHILRDVPGTRSVYAERVQGGYYLDFKVRRRDAARYGMTVEAVEQIIETAVGGMNVTTTVEGRERYPVNVRYPRDLRENLDKLQRVLVTTPRGVQVPIALLADLELKTGPAMIRDEDGMLTGYVFVDVVGRDLGSYVNEAKQAVAEKLPAYPGYRLTWSGQYEFMERVAERLKFFVPLTLGIIFLLYFFTFRSVTETCIVMLSVPFALLGGIWSLYLLEYNLSIAVWVGLIALAGIAAETASIMIVYLDEEYRRRVAAGRMNSMQDLFEAVLEGTAQRLRPMMMTVG